MIGALGGSGKSMIRFRVHGRRDEPRVGIATQPRLFGVLPPPMQAAQLYKN